MGTINSANPSAGSVTVTALQAIAHEAYNKATLVNDIALLKLPGPMTLSGFLNLLLFLNIIISVCRQYQTYCASSIV